MITVWHCPLLGFNTSLDRTRRQILFVFFFLFFYMYRLNAVFYLYFIVTYWNFFLKIVVCNSFRLCFHILSHPVSINKQFMSYSNCDMYRWWGQCGLLPVQRLNFSSGLTLITFSVSEVWILMDEVWVKFDLGLLFKTDQGSTQTYFVPS